MESHLRTTAFASSQADPGGCSPLSLLCVLVLVFVAPELRAGTTIYVGKHFEVREHDAPVKYVFNGSTRVARITGSLSANERIQKLRLRAGWNLVSLAVAAPNFLDQLSEFTSGPAPVIEALYRWQPVTKDYGPIAPGETMAAGTVLWISARTDVVVATRGGYVEPGEWGVPPGGTFVATPALEAQPLTVPAGVTVWRYDARNQQWQAGLTGDLAALSDVPSTLSPGEAIYIHSNDPADLGAPAREERLRYYHHDHLGSSSVMTDATGALVEETAFYPFGIPRHEHRPGQMEEAYKFTQKERDQESGLHYFEARYFTGSLSRFASADPKYAGIPPVGNPQQLNLYAYTRNSPLQYIDPTGLDIFDAIWIPGRDSIDELDLDATIDAVDNLTSGGGPARILAGAAEGVVGSALDGIGAIIGINTANAPGFDRQGKPVTTYPSLSFEDHAKDIVLEVGGGKVFQSVTKVMGKSLGRQAPSVSPRSTIDPLADTVGVSPTAGSRGSGVGQVRSAQIGGGGFGATPVVGGGGGMGAAETAYMKLFQQQNESLQAMRTIALGGEVQIDSAITRMAFEQADAIWRSTYGTRPPISIPRR